MRELMECLFLWEWAGHRMTHKLGCLCGGPFVAGWCRETVVGGAPEGFSRVMDGAAGVVA